MAEWLTFDDDGRITAIESEKVCAMELNSQGPKLKVWIAGLATPFAFEGETAKWFWQKIGGFSEDEEE